MTYEPSEVGTPAEVRLRLPADPRYLSIARLTASALAAQAQATYEEVEEVMLAVSELSWLLMDSGDTDTGLELTYAVGAGVIRVRGHLPARSRQQEPPSPSDLHRRVLAAAVDEYSLRAEDGTLSFSLTKRLGVR